MNKYIGYARVSTLRQVKQHSLDVQRDAIKKYCEANKYHLVKIYEDKGISAYKERPEFDTMMYQLLNGDYQGVIIHDLTRFGRSTIDLLTNISEIDKAGKKFISIRDGFDLTTKIGKLLLGLLSLIADFERQTLIERIEAGKERARQYGTKSGKPMHRPPKKIDWQKVKEYKALKLSWTATAKLLHITPTTLIKRAKEKGVYE